MGKILVSASHYDVLCKEAWELLEEKGHEVIFETSRSFPAYSSEELKKILPNIDAAIIGLDEYTEEIFKVAPKLKAVAKFGVGVDNIDCQAATKYGVKVLNAPGMNSNAVAELTVGLMIDLLRKLIPLHEAVKAGAWPRSMGREIKGKTIGLLGLGSIARLVARKLQCFDAEVIAYDLYPDLKKAGELNVTMVSMDEVIEKSDILSIHIPPSPETYHLFNDATFAKMKDKAYIINAARGALIDLDALSRALKSGKLTGAALDAFEMEPLSGGEAILSCENVILTPHTGGETEEAYRNISLCTAKDIIKVLDGDIPECWVNR